jgi:hypothetical protein
MTNKELLDIIQDEIRQMRLAKALNSIENYLLTYSTPKEMERLIGLREDYRLMVDYWQRGFQDPQRQKVYQSLLQRVYMLATDLKISDFN